MISSLQILFAIYLTVALSFFATTIFLRSFEADEKNRLFLSFLAVHSLIWPITIAYYLVKSILLSGIQNIFKEALAFTRREKE